MSRNKFGAKIKIKGQTLDASADEIDALDGITSSVSELNILTGVTATAAEINRALDVSARLVALTGTDAITVAEHEGRDMYVTGTDAATYTMPEATGSGGRYRFIIGEVNTNGNVFASADATNAGFIGSVNILDEDAAAQAAYASRAVTNDLITLNGTTTGGQVGDIIEFVDVAADTWMVRGQLGCPAGSNPATPFSSTA